MCVFSCVGLSVSLPVRMSMYVSIRALHVCVYMHRGMDGWVDRWMDGWMDAGMQGCRDAGMDECMNGCMAVDGCQD